jgi:hypothetical protein
MLTSDFYRPAPHRIDRKLRVTSASFAAHFPRGFALHPAVPDFAATTRREKFSASLPARPDIRLRAARRKTCASAFNSAHATYDAPVRRGLAVAINGTMPPAYPSASTLKPLGAPLDPDSAVVTPAFPFASLWRRLCAFAHAPAAAPASTPAPTAGPLRVALEVADRAALPSRTAAPPAVAHYFATLQHAWDGHDWSDVTLLFETLLRAWREGRQVFLCGNGGSAANAIHLANDLLYGVDKQSGRGLRVTALPANPSVLTCLANDVSYADVFSQQLTVLAQSGDILIVLSGSGS